jgi:hypothetical protein
MTFVIAALIAMVALIVKLTIDMYSLLVIIRKEARLLAKNNDLNTRYQFLKGLY